MRCKRCLAHPGEYLNLVKRNPLESKLRSIEFTRAGERVVRRKRCLACPAEHANLVKRDPL